MICERVEELLPRYVEEDLSSDERSAVDEHLAGCESCRASLSFYEELEGSLVSLRDVRPSPARAAAAVSERLGLGARAGFRWIWPPVPVLTGIALIVVGVVMYVFRGVLWSAFSAIGRGAPTAVSRAIGDAMTGLSAGVTQFAGTGEWVLLSVYLGLFALVMLAGSWMVLRFVRE